MKKINYLFVLSALMLVASGCDKINIDETHKPYTPPVGNKTVLIKDFTGARCVNCPAAAEYAHQLQHTLGEDRIFILSIHAGFQAQPMGNFPDFTTEEGTQWYNDNNANPLFSVDHVALTEGNTLNETQLDVSVSKALNEAQLFDITITNAYDETTRNLDVENLISPTGDGNGNYYATVCLVEDSLVGWQKVPTSTEFPQGLNQEYVFRNVFRGTLNGADGELVSNGQFYVTDSFKTNCSMVLDTTFNADQCYIMTYVYDKSDGKILQTAMEKVK